MMNRQAHGMSRWWRHLTMTRWRIQRAFPPAVLQAITDSVRASELLHGGEIRVAIEAERAVWPLLQGQTPRQRALEVFAKLGVWDTAQRNGVLIYLCVADRCVEIVVDRGLQGRVSDAEWGAICVQLQNDCAASQFQTGMCQAVTAAGRLLGRHFPGTDRNEQPDQPVFL